MQIFVKDLVKSLDYSLTYFLKILSRCNVKSRIILDIDDLHKIYECLKVKNKKSLNLHLKLKSLISEVSHVK